MCCKKKKKKLLPSLHQKVPLHIAAGDGHLDIVRYLVEDKGADKHVKDNLGVSDVNHFTFIGCMRNTLSTTNCANREVVAVLDRLHVILLLLHNFKLQHTVFLFKSII